MGINRKMVEKYEAAYQGLQELFRPFQFQVYQ